MIPYYIQKYTEVDHTTINRKAGICPICDREELISKDSELVKCSICCQMRQDDKPSVKGEDIRKLREEIGVSLKSLCYDLKIDKSLFLKIERGDRPVNSTLTEWYKRNAQNSPLKTGVEKDISTYQPPLFCPPYNQY